MKHFISGVLTQSKNTYELATQTNRSEVSSSGVVSVSLPRNTIINLDSIMMKADLVYEHAGQMVHSAHDLISRLELFANGRPLISINNYNHVYKLMENYVGQDYISKQAVYSGGYSNTAELAINTPTRLYFTNFLGLSSIKPSFLDTSIIGDLELRLTLAPKSVIPIANVLADYKIKNISFLCETISVPAVFYDAHNAVLMSGQSLPVIFDTFRTITQSGVSPSSSTTRFSVSSQSINYIMASKYPDFNASVSSDPVSSNKSSVFKRDGSHIDNWFFRVNNQQYPNYSADGQDAWVEMMKATNTLTDVLGGIDGDISRENFRSSYWCCAASLAIPNSGSDRFISGLNSEGSAIEIDFTTTGSGGTGTTTDLVIVNITSIINVYAGKQLELVD
jgi:hypothetical protein